MAYTAPVAEQRVVRETISTVEALGVNGDPLNAVLETPRSHAEDTFGPRPIGADVVRLDGYRSAYKAAGGQGLPFEVQPAVLDAAEAPT